MEKRDPHAIIQRWLPHLIVVGVLGLGVWLLALVYAPVAQPILLAAALALMTTHVLFTPIDNGMSRVLPRLSVATRQQISGILATLLLLFIALLPVFLLLASTLGTVADLGRVLWGICLGDDAQLEVLRLAIENDFQGVARLYPDLGLDPQYLSAGIVSTIREATDFGSSFLAFIFKGTGVLAQLVWRSLPWPFSIPRAVIWCVRCWPIARSKTAKLKRSAIVTDKLCCAC